MIKLKSKNQDSVRDEEYRGIKLEKGSYWFRRIQKDMIGWSEHLKLVRIAHGFYRIYYKQAYVGELYKEMPKVGYNIEDEDMNLSDKTYYINKMEDGEVQRKIKNFVEGYSEVKDQVRTRFYMLKHDSEFYKEATGGYKRLNV